MGPKLGENEDQNKRDNNIANNTSGNKKSYMVLPYVRGLSESMKMYAINMGYRYITEEKTPSKAS